MNSHWYLLVHGFILFFSFSIFVTPSLAIEIWLLLFPPSIFTYCLILLYVTSLPVLPGCCLAWHPYLHRYLFGSTSSPTKWLPCSALSLLSISNKYWGRGRDLVAFQWDFFIIQEGRERKGIMCLAPLSAWEMKAKYHHWCQGHAFLIRYHSLYYGITAAGTT